MSALPLAPSLEDEVPQVTAAFFRRALQLLVDAGVPFLVGGAFAHACFTGIRRSTKDLDLFIRREHYDRVAELGPRHLEILEMVLSGCTNQEISDSMGLALGTVKNYVSSLLLALDVKSRSHLVSLFR